MSRLAVWIAICVGACGPGGSRPDGPYATESGKLLAAIEGGGDQGHRAAAARRLSEVVMANPSKEPPADLVVRLGRLLAERDEEVRLWTAGALGALGPRARQAIPALEAAIRVAQEEENREPVRPAFSALSAMQLALQRIRGEVPVPEGSP